MKEKTAIDSYQGQLLIAHPNNPEDNLKQGVLLVISYADPMCIGIQLNRPIEHLKLASICRNMDIEYSGTEYLYHGGLVGTGKVHVVHSNDWQGPSTVKVTDQLSVTSDISVLVALSQGQGPEYFRSIAGYWTWSKNILDSQLGLSNKRLTDYKWETVPATLERVFEFDREDQWQYCMQASAEMQVNSWF